jgi:hypothetical protein
MGLNMGAWKAVQIMLVVQYQVVVIQGTAFTEEELDQN